MRGFLRAVTAVAATAVVMVVPHVGAPQARAQIPEMAPCWADAELVVGVAGGSVYCTQWTLMWLGYLRTPITGVYDQPTFDAVIIFQQNNGLRVNGHADAPTLTALGIYSGVDQAPPPPCLADAPVSPGDVGASTECLQHTLESLGIFGGPADGKYGNGTRDAVRNYQLGNPPLEANGIAGTQTLAALGIWSGFTREQGSDTFNGGTWWPSPLQAEPNWRLVSGIPVFGNRRGCTKENADIIAREFAKDGADVSTQQFYIYIASREGGCDHTSVNFNLQTRDDSHCTFQLNALSGMFNPNGELGRRGWNTDNVKASMQNCADAASDLWVFCARGPWTPPYSCAPPWEGDLGPEGDA